MIVGLTGGIGSGKSMAAKVFALMGCALFNSDEEAKKVYYQKEVREQVISLLGDEAYERNGQINKTHISSKIFNDTALLESLNNIIHPAVISRFQEFCDQHKNKIIIKESALLFEAKIDKYCDTVVTVIAPLEIRIKRVMERDGISKQDVEKKLASQWTDQERAKRSDHLIYNDEKHSIIQQVNNLFLLLKIQQRKKEHDGV